MHTLLVWVCCHLAMASRACRRHKIRDCTWLIVSTGCRARWSLVVVRAGWAVTCDLCSSSAVGPKMFATWKKPMLCVGAAAGICLALALASMGRCTHADAVLHKVQVPAFRGGHVSVQTGKAMMPLMRRRSERILAIAIVRVPCVCSGPLKTWESNSAACLAAG